MAAAHPFGSFVGCRFKRIGIARLQETTSQCALTLCHAVFRVLRLRALVGPALRPPASQCAPGLKVECATVADGSTRSGFNNGQYILRNTEYTTVASSVLGASTGKRCSINVNS